MKYDNWRPTYQLADILKEILSMNELKRTVKYVIAIQEITKKKEIPKSLGYTILEYLSADNTAYPIDFIKESFY
jgi:hypothetical protein